MSRDIEDMILETLMFELYEVTSIPTGRIHCLVPLFDQVVKLDGPNVTDAQYNAEITFPAIAIDFYDSSIYKYNNYGDIVSVAVSTSSGVVTRREYQPIGEIKCYVEIALYTVSRKDQIDYGILIEDFLFANRYLNFFSDAITGEYFTIKLNHKTNLKTYQPYVRVYSIECCARTLKEVTGYGINEITVGLDTVTEVTTTFNSTDIYTFDSDNW